MSTFTISSIQLEIQRLFKLYPLIHKKCPFYYAQTQRFCTISLSQRAQSEIWSITRALAQKTRLSPEPTSRAHGNELAATLKQLAACVLCPRHSPPGNILLLAYQWLAVAEVNDRLFPLQPSYQRRLRDPQEFLALIIMWHLNVQQARSATSQQSPRVGDNQRRAVQILADDLFDDLFGASDRHPCDTLSDALVEFGI